MLKRFKKLAKDFGYGKRKRLQKIKNSVSLAMCEKCFAFYYKNAWHLSKPTYLVEYDEEEVPIFFTKCSACVEQEEAMYEKESSLSFS
jgi:hypothetical protein